MDRIQWPGTYWIDLYDRISNSITESRLATLLNEGLNGWQLTVMEYDGRNVGLDMLSTNSRYSKSSALEVTAALKRVSLWKMFITHPLNKTHRDDAHINASAAVFESSNTSYTKDTFHWLLELFIEHESRCPIGAANARKILSKPKSIA